MKQLSCLFLLCVFIKCAQAQTSFGFSFTSNAKDSVFVDQVFSNGPAYKAGLRSGDFLISVNGSLLTGKSASAILGYFKFLSDAGNTFIIKRNNDTLSLKIDKAPATSITDCISKDCSNGPCELKLMNGGTIKGQCRNGVINGEASIYTPTGQLAFTGQVLNNMPNGKGKMFGRDGLVYEGDMVNGRPNGTGTVTYSNGEAYKGQWVDGKKEGNGVWNSSTGDRYTGAYHDNLKHGKGTMRYKDGGVYEGDYVNDVQEGTCTYTYKDGSKYTGSFKEFNKNGKGVMVWPNGDKYDGEWKNDTREGKGILYYTDGRKYEGDWVNDECNGNGVVIYTDGKKFEGKFLNGKTVNGTINYPDGKKITGDIIDMNPVEGRATVIYKDGRKETYAAFKPKSPVNPQQKNDLLRVLDLASGSAEDFFLPLRGQLTSQQKLEGKIITTFKNSILVTGCMPLLSWNKIISPKNNAAADDVMIAYGFKDPSFQSLLEILNNYLGKEMTNVTDTKAGQFYEYKAKTNNGLSISLSYSQKDAYAVLLISTAVKRRSGDADFCNTLTSIVNNNFNNLYAVKGKYLGLDGETQAYESAIKLPGIEKSMQIGITSTLARLVYGDFFSSESKAKESLLDFIKKTEHCLNIHFGFEMDGSVPVYMYSPRQNPESSIKNIIAISLEHNGSQYYVHYDFYFSK
jgi:hypothetical protein